MTDTATAAVMEQPGRIDLREFPLPDIGPEDALLRVQLAGVCGSDVKHFSKPLASRTEGPLIMGHEVVGSIAAIGERAAQRWGVEVDDNVIVHSIFGCGKCYECMSGHYRYCAQGGGYGTKTSSTVKPHLWGGFADHMYLDQQSMVFKVPPNIDAETAVLVSASIANGIRWTRTIGNVSIGDYVVIEGAGPQGLAAVAAARESGAGKVIISGLQRDSARLRMATKFGADHTIVADEEDIVERVRELTAGEMADVVVDVSGAPAAAAAAFQLVRHHGTVVGCSLTAGREVSITPDQLALNEIRYQGCFTHDVQSVKAALRLLTSAKYPFDELVTHRFGLADVPEAIRVAGGDGGEGAIKVVIDPTAT